MREKNLLGLFKGFLRSSRLLSPLKMVPSIARGHFGAKKVDSYSNTLRKAPISVFHKVKKIMSTNYQNQKGIGRIMPHWPIYTAINSSKLHDLLEKPLKMV